MSTEITETYPDLPQRCHCGVGARLKSNVIIVAPNAQTLEHFFEKRLFKKLEMSLTEEVVVIPTDNLTPFLSPLTGKGGK